VCEKVRSDSGVKITNDRWQPVCWRCFFSWELSLGRPLGIANRQRRWAYPPVTLYSSWKIRQADSPEFSSPLYNEPTGRPSRCRPIRRNYLPANPGIFGTGNGCNCRPACRLPCATPRLAAALPSAAGWPMGCLPICLVLATASLSALQWPMTALASNRSRLRASLNVFAVARKPPGTTPPNIAAWVWPLPKKLSSPITARLGWTLP